MLAAQISGKAKNQRRRGSRVNRTGEQVAEGCANRGNVVALDDAGNVIGKVRAPVSDIVFGYGRGSVYLMRDH
jgi:hypothetical protein